MEKKTRPPDQDRLDQVVARAQQERQQRERGYRERALGMYPWVCGRCGRGFDHGNAFIKAKKWALVAVDRDPDDQPVHQACRPAKNVGVPVGDGIKSSGIKTCAHPKLRLALGG